MCMISTNKEIKWARNYDKCIECGTTSIKHHSKGLCFKCAQRKYELNRPPRMCDICKKEGRISKIIGSQNICRNCYAKIYSPKKECDLCHKVSKIAKSENGVNICASCYTKHYRPQRECAICHQIAPIATTANGINVCHSCYKSQTTPRKCSICNTEKYIEAVIDGNDICKSCYDKKYRPKYTCGVCGEYRTVKLDLGYMKVCTRCYDKSYRPERNCSICKERRIIKKIIDNKYICDKCYSYYAPKRKCSICGEIKRIKKKIDESDICESCYNKTQNTCTECGKVTSSFNYGLKICDNCAYKRKLSSKIIQLQNEFQTDHFFSLYKKYIFTLLDNNYAGAKTYYKVMGEIELFKSFETAYLSSGKLYNDVILDYCKNNYIPLSLYNFFVSDGIKLDFEDEFQAFEQIYRNFVLEVPDKFKSIFSSYSLSLINMKKKIINRGWNNKFSKKYYISCLTQAILYLDYLSYQINNISELSQSLFDDYIINHCTNFFALKKFLLYVNKNVNLFRKIHIPIVINDFNDHSYTVFEMDSIFDSLMQSEVKYRDKMIGMLLLFYGIRPIEIVNITLDDYKVANNSYSLFVRNTWIMIDPLIGQIINSYIIQERTNRLSLGSQKNWLIPSKKYNSSTNEKYICQILNKYGIQVRRAFQTALKNFLLAEEGIPSILICGMGINISTTMNYYKFFSLNNIYESDCLLETRSALVNVNNSIDTNSTYFIYILKCSDGSYYTGFTADLQRRLDEHKSGKGCTYTKTRIPIELVYSEKFAYKSEALRREKQIKKLTIFEKEKLIERSRMI